MNMSINKILAFCLFIGILHGEFKIFVSPQLVELEIPPGGRRRFKISVINESPAKTIKLKVYAADIFENLYGLYKIADSTDSCPYSCKDWLEISADSLELKPGEGKVVKCLLKVPRGIWGGRYAAVVFELLPEEPEKRAKASVVYHFRLPTFVEVTIRKRGAKRKAMITDFRVIKTSEDEHYGKLFGSNNLIFLTKVKNVGDIHIFAKGRIIIRNEKGRRIKEFPLGAGRGLILPEAEVLLRSVTPVLKKGNYSAEATIDYGSLTSAVARASFTIARRKVHIAEFKSTMPMDLEVIPGSLFVKLPCRACRTLVFQVRNYENKAISAQVSVIPFHHNLDGDLVLKDRKKPEPRSAAKWFETQPESLLIKGQGKGKIKAVIHVPDSLDPGGYYAALRIRLHSPEDSSSKPIDLTANIPVFISIIGQAEKKGRVNKILVDARRRSPPAFYVYFKNTGDVHINPSGLLRIKKYQGEKKVGELQVIPGKEWNLVKEIKIDRVYPVVLPGDTRKIEVASEDILPPGKYMAEAIINLGEKGKVATCQKVFYVK